MLYGIGVRLDREPELLFVLRKVNQQDLVAQVGATLERGARRPRNARVLEADLSAVFGIEISDAIPPTVKPSRRPRRSAER